MDYRLRQRLIARVAGTPVEAPLRGVQALLESPVAKRNRAEHARLRLLLAWSLGEADGCVDVGASKGIVLEEIVRLSPSGYHVAYEPVPDLHGKLARRFPDVDVRRAALSARTGESDFTHFPSMPGFSRLGTSQSVHGHVGRPLRVRTETLDESLPSGYVPALIKIDAEGADREVLEGGIETISEHRPTVVFEHSIASAAEDDGDSERLVELLCRQAGLRIFDLQGDGPYDAAALRRAYSFGRRLNFVAHP